MNGYSSGEGGKKREKLLADMMEECWDDRQTMSGLRVGDRGVWGMMMDVVWLVVVFAWGRSSSSEKLKIRVCFYFIFFYCWGYIHRYFLIIIKVLNF